MTTKNTQIMRKFQEIATVVCQMFQEYMKEVITLAPKEDKLWLEQTARKIALDCAAITEEEMAVRGLEQQYAQL